MSLKDIMRRHVNKYTNGKVENKRRFCDEIFKALMFVGDTEEWARKIKEIGSATDFLTCLLIVGNVLMKKLNKKVLQEKLLKMKPYTSLLDHK